MKLSSLIGHIVEIYETVFASQKPADRLIELFFRERKYLGSHDRRFIAEALYALLRHKSRIDWAISFIQSNEKKTFLSCIAVLLLERKEALDGLLKENILPGDILIALSRNLESLPAIENFVKRTALEFSFQEWMIEKWIRQYGEQHTKQLCAALNIQAPITLRVNTLKTTVEECQNSLKQEGVETVPTLYSPFGLQLQRRMNVFQLNTFRKGFFEVQDEGSQLLALLVNPKPRKKVIDACAGAGGKSLAMASLMKNKGEIFSLDIYDFKLNELTKRIKRAGADTIRRRVVSENESPLDLHNSADYVLIDAPCSGSGTIRRNPGMKWSVTEAMINELSIKQRMILDNYARCVTIGGMLVYATCSLFDDENENIIASFLNEHSDFLLIHPSEILSAYTLENLVNNKYFQLMPYHHGTDGFFAAVMKRIN